MESSKTIIFLGDGMADEPLPELNNKTPLQHADTPAMDSIAHAGRCGTLLTLPEGFPTSSDVANMSVLGCNLEQEYCGRGPLEAIGRNIELAPDDKAFRLNLVTVEEGRLTDFSGGHLAQSDADELITVLNQQFGSKTIKFHPGVSYRNILVLSGPEYSHKIKAGKPDDNKGELISEKLPRALEAEAEATAAFLVRLMQEAPAVLGQTAVNQRLVKEGKVPANGVWPWSGGCAGALRTLKEKYGITGAVISAVDVIIGLGRALGMDVINVPGATGYIDTNYEGKADAAIEAIKSHDLVFVHVEAIDEVSHAQDLEKKLSAIEDFDKRLVARVLNAVGDTVNVAVLPDHPVPLALGKHTRVPVPVAVRMKGFEPDTITTFDEVACSDGSLGKLIGPDFMDLLFIP
ncbi:cofactor-independent phosphoglycerate mutase [Oligoflexia bacterium]|nr:cofactor-independent phosphoglycerate mutase [Oligoflexia bacterium]